MIDGIKTALETPTAYKWAGLLLRPEETVAHHRVNGASLYKLTPDQIRVILAALNNPK